MCAHSIPCLLGFIAFSAFSAASQLFAFPSCILEIDEVPPAGETQVWSPLFQACWEKLNGLQAGELERVDPPNTLIAQLEAFQWEEKSVMPIGGYAVFAGPATPEFARETVASIRERFGVDIDPERFHTSPNGNATYGILLRELRFKEKFFRSRKQPLAFQSQTGEAHLVEFFGTAGSFSDRYGETVKVLHYEPIAPTFTLSIATDREDEALIVYRPNHSCSFRAAIDHVKKAKANPLSGSYGSLSNGSLHQKDVVKIPYVTIKANTDFRRQLKGSLYFAGEAMPWRIVKAFQMTKFELFEDGVRVRVDAGVDADPFGDPPKPPRIVPRTFVCDRPFFVFLWREGAGWPYLGAWVDGASCLTPFSKK